MELSFIKTDPTGNTTILIDTPVSRSEQPAFAARLMSPRSVGGEQVGFIEPATLPGCRARLQMMGGEFCGNAAMSLAAVLTERDGDIPLEVSGCETPIRCSLETRNGQRLGTVDMPLPERIGELAGLPAVFFPGIVHLIAPADAYTDAEAEHLVRSLCLGSDLEAVGLLLFREKDRFMRPCVYVSGPNSVTWENGCASGTAAIGAWYAVTKGLSDISVSQPGGIITAHCQVEDGILSALSITGQVTVTARGTAYL